MNLDEIKTAWKAYDHKLKATQHIHEKIIVSMITDRSSTRFVHVKRKYVLGILWMVICLAAGVAVLFGNPFDYEYVLQYVPIAIYTLCITLLTAKLAVTYLQFNSIVIQHHTIRDALKKIIKLYEVPEKFFKYTIIVFLFTQVVLFPLSFLPKGIERMGLWYALTERLIPIAISALLLYIAYKLGAFKNSDEKKFREDLNELETLKALSSELAD